jgi:copper chaperone CopZ
VQSVKVDLGTKQVSVVADERVSEAALAAAINEAGYDIAAAS